MIQAELYRGRVGVAPSTTTMVLGSDPIAASCYGSPMLQAQVNHNRYTNPYVSIPDMRGGAGLGIVCPQDWWMTGRPYGLPGTTALKIQGDNVQLIGAGGFGAAIVPPFVNPFTSNSNPAPALESPMTRGDASFFLESVHTGVEAAFQAERKRNYIIGGIAGGLGLLGIIIALARK